MAVIRQRRAVVVWVTFERHELELHGQRVSYRVAGSGPALLLLHGIANSSDTWARVAPLLSDRFTVIAPDLLGHGESAAPRGDYSLGAHASGARDVATSLGHDRVTVVGHSLGGGIAMQFAYQFPERTERLVLVSSGGLGRDVHLLLRAASLPGSDLVLPALTSQRLVELGRGLGGLLGKVGLHPSADIAVLARGFAELDNAGSRQAFLATLRAVVAEKSSVSAPPDSKMASLPSARSVSNKHVSLPTPPSSVSSPSPPSSVSSPAPPLA